MELFDVHVQKEENQRVWNYLMYLQDHMHQFVVYMRNKNKDFLNFLLQLFNFQASAATAATESEEQSKFEEEPLPAEEEKEEKEKEREETEEEESIEEESAVKKDEASSTVPLKRGKSIL